ncbi:MAG: tetratricopeptide repeat protein [Paludibacteraceae bacterium]|nr:tetratricopeptide repeat protein [Paludibacteraceae bacterium]
MCCVLSACHWQEARQVIALADSLDQTEHVIYDDTAVLGRTIRCLDNPVGRLLMSNTLGKAYYYMGRNYSLSDQIVEAAECYIEADRLQIDDPIYRGRVNSCMGYICAQNDNDSLALIFYERSNNAFKESGNEWYYAQSLLNVSQCHVYLHRFGNADSLLNVAQTYQLDSAYMARYYETNGLYFYELHQYDSALVYFQEALDYWQTKKDKCFSWLRILQIYYRINQIGSAVPYAEWIVANSNNPNYCSNAYYILIENAKSNNNIELLATYSHQREDINRLLEQQNECYSLAHQCLKTYLSNPHPLRWVWIILSLIVVICIILAIGAVVYRQRNRIACEQIDQLSTHIENQEARLSQELYYRQFGEKLSNIVDRYHTPHKRWRNYSVLKKDLAPWLHDWTTQLDALPLSEQDKIFCTISLIYPNLSDVEIADYMCYTKGSIRVLKNRILKKIGVSSSEFSKFLHNLSNCK